MHPSLFYAERAKSKARGILRQILFSIALTAAAIMLWDGEVRWWWIIAPYSIPIGVVAWLIFRILSFAAGPLPHRFRR